MLRKAFLSKNPFYQVLGSKIERWYGGNGDFKLRCIVYKQEKLSFPEKLRLFVEKWRFIPNVIEFTCIHNWKKWWISFHGKNMNTLDSFWCLVIKAFFVVVVVTSFCPSGKIWIEPCDHSFLIKFSRCW